VNFDSGGEGHPANTETSRLPSNSNAGRIAIAILEIAMTNVIVVIGAGSIGQAIARRVSAGKHVLLADLRQDNVDAAAKVLGDAGFEVSTAIVDVSSRTLVQVLLETATAVGTGSGLIHAAVSPPRRHRRRRS
jgi:nucleoside-diphosphate-sugar epimerase